MFFQISAQPNGKKEEALKQQLERLAGNQIQLELIQCTDRSHENLAITELAPLPGPQVTGVALRMRIQVTNHGQLPVKHVPVQLTQRMITAESHERIGIARCDYARKD